MIILDTSALYALLRAEDPMQQAVLDVVRRAPVRVVSPYVVAELDYLFLTRYGVSAELQVLEELASGAFDLAALSSADLLGCTRVITEFSDHAVGVTDASLVVLADRYRTRRIVTLDRRHFSVLRGLDGRPFELLP